MSDNNFNHIVLSAGNGAEEADNHYLETGHTIRVIGKKDNFYTRDRIMKDFVKTYECLNCDFKDFNGKRYAIY